MGDTRQGFKYIYGVQIEPPRDGSSVKRILGWYDLISIRRACLCKGQWKKISCTNVFFYFGATYVFQFYVSLDLFDWIRCICNLRKASLQPLKEEVHFSHWKTKSKSRPPASYLICPSWLLGADGTSCGQYLGLWHVQIFWTLQRTSIHISSDYAARKKKSSSVCINVSNIKFPEAPNLRLTVKWIRHCSYRCSGKQCAVIIIKKTHLRQRKLFILQTVLSTCVY